jgi:hypothetical protein
MQRLTEAMEWVKILKDALKILGQGCINLLS